MSGPAVRDAAAKPPRCAEQPVRLAFVGSSVWLDACAPTGSVPGFIAERFDFTSRGDERDDSVTLETFQPHVTVIFDPASAPHATVSGSGGVTLGVLVAGLPPKPSTQNVSHLDRLVSFMPALTGEKIGGAPIWRAIPPPVSDLLFDDLRSLHHVPRVMSIGRSSPRRETMLMGAKHYHDLLQVIHGVSGETLRELLSEYDVGVFVGADCEGGFGHQVGIHLAAGHLLLADELKPAHGLERGIDYLAIDSPDALLSTLDRLARFPEMYQRIRVRGRLKAEQFRASSLFRRLAHDVLADVAAFGRAR
jgi:hypothetical protein